MPGMIEDYALIGDMRSAALISRDGSVDWLCVPRFDSPACFAALLGDDRHGHWSIAPAAAPDAVDHIGGSPRPPRHPAQASPGPESATHAMGDGITVTRRYRGDTLILETDWHTPAGTVRVTDFMPPRDGNPPALVRIVEGLSGTVDMSCVFRVRFGYGQITPWVRREDSSVLAVAGPDALWLATPITLTGRSFAHEATFRVMAGERVPFVLIWKPSHESRAGPRRRAPGRGGNPEILGRVGLTLHLPGHLPRGGGPLPDHAEGAHLPAHRRDRGRGHHVAA